MSGRGTVRLALAVAVLAALALAVTRRARRPIAARPNVVLVTIDTERADHTSTYGYPHATTPHLDALAADGAVFTSAYTAIPTTGPSHAGVFICGKASAWRHLLRRRGASTIPRTLVKKNRG